MKKFPIVSILACLATVLYLANPTLASSRIEPFNQAQVVNVSVNFNSHIPIPDLDPEALANMQKSSRVLIYEMANKECEILTASIAETCRLTNLNISTQVQMNYNNNNPPLLYINGGATFSISLKQPSPAEQ